jgi:hypothetical protein
MSIPIQTSGPDQLAGGQAPLTPPERRGNEFPQSFPLTGAKGTTQVDNDVPASTVSPNLSNGAATRDKGDVSNMNVGYGRSVVARPVDARNIAGSFKGDTRCKPGDTAAASLAKAADNGGPRARVGQFANNGKTPQDAGFQSYPGNTADSDAGN